ncbi:MAG: protein kinase [Myxococcales bacterium]|nr:protein kinase [Myxococcales bacterium]
MASVYEAEAIGEGLDAPRVVALKVLNPDRVLQEEVRRFTREYRALSRMNHENVVRVYDTGVHRGYPWIAMEMVDGRDLETEIEAWRASDPDDRFERIERILRGICLGLGYVHDHGLVHRDLKPSNVLLTEDGTPKISDFGVVKSESTASTQLTLAGRLVGTVAFMAPELITDENVDLRADLYALGAVLYLMVTFRRPIEAETVAGYLARHLTEVPRPLTELEPRAPQRLEQLAQRLLQKDRTFRHPSAHAVLQALDRSDVEEIPPLRGRDEVGVRWTRRLAQLQEGAGAAVALLGTSGSGKTHVFDTLVEQVRAHGMRIGVARGGHAPVIPQLAQGLGQGARARTAQELEALLRTDPEAPTVLAVDDLDAAGSQEIQELSRLIRTWVTLEARPLLLLLTTSPTEAELDGELSALQSGQSTGLECDVEALGPIDVRAAIAMSRDRGVTGPVAAALGRRLHQMYGGVPGAIVRQLDALLQEGWLRPDGDHLVANRPLASFKHDELPVPPAVRRAIEEDLARLAGDARRMVELLSVLDRPVSPALFDALAPSDAEEPGLHAPERVLEELVRIGIVQRESDDTEERIQLSDPCTARVVDAALKEEERRELHATLARALATRRRRSQVLQIAHHLKAAGEVARSWPLYVQAARRSARDGRHSDVIDICKSADEIEDAATEALPAAEVLKHRRWLNLLRGEALLERRSFVEAAAHLQVAARDARAEGHRPMLARSLAGLGRAQYRKGNFDEAQRALEEALQGSEPDATLLAPTLRLLGDLALRRGQLDQAEALWSNALQAALSTSSGEDEARARRGLAHLRTIEGSLASAAKLLNHAEELLNPDGDYRVRASVLARLTEIDAVAGRFGSALYRAELLVELAKRHGLADRMPIAFALQGEVLTSLGHAELAHEALRQATLFIGAAEGPTWEARMRVARTLMDLADRSHAGAFAAAAELLPDEADLPSSGVTDPLAQWLVLRARVAASSQDPEAAALTRRALDRPAPLLGLSDARMALDAAKALAETAPEEARRAMSRGLEALPDEGVDGMRLELMLSVQRPGSEVPDTLATLVGRILPLLPPRSADSFKARNAVLQRTS